MTRPNENLTKLWRYGGMFLVIAVTMGHGFLWILTGAVLYTAVLSLLVYLTPAPSLEEEARKNAEWLAQIDRDYKRVRSVEDRLDELERLKRRDLVTPEEYSTKRQDILKDL